MAASAAWGQPESPPPAPPSALSHWGSPLLQVAGANAALASYNKWITEAHYGQITFATMRSNLGGGMVYDADNFSVNQIGHPYQGSLYYSAARHYGHDYYRGAVYASLGSLQWEYLLETEQPAFNDLITTTLGGAMLGEITSRLAYEILDPRARGTERFVRELSAGLVNPTLGLNRMLDGSAFRTSGPPREPGHRPRLLLRAATGGILRSRTQGTDSDLPGLDAVPKGTTEFLIWYGDEYRAKKAFDFFLVNLGLDFTGDPVSSIYARGLLGSHHLFGDGEDYGMLTWGQNFDYIKGGIYKIGASGIGGGYSQRFRWGDRWYHVFQVMVGGIALGGASTEYFQRGERDYNLGPGAFSTTRIVLGKYEFGHLALNIDRYWIYTVSGARGHELLGLGMFEASKSLYKSLGSILSYTFYDRTAQYEDHPARSRLNQEIRFALHLGFH
jgi:hypothetical protein